ncbi:hypothetical protein MSAN_01910000 [Mycena sanguinolenta]|uniref:DUF6533 domain-containing protein n=1 Tax=Mycena sanguinolenta TaxID=230812 RepID=A0A8H6XRM7_9AGAR|nr:hypothetical protein MSAN_01910000 [Mycena sanguinolenta]
MKPHLPDVWALYMQHRRYDILNGLLFFMSDYPLRSLRDLMEPDYATLTYDSLIMRCFFLAGLSILTYDHLLTFGAEVKYIWSSKLRLGTCWFLAIRYLGLCTNITICAYYFIDWDHEVCRWIVAPPASSNCVGMQWAWMMFVVILELLVEVTLTVRVFAMYGLNKWILACLLCVNAGIAIVGLFAVIEYGKHPDLIIVSGISGCHLVYPRSAATPPAGAWEAILVCDILVFVLTARKALVHRKTIPLYAGSLIERMATDGTMYFGIIVLANLANVLTFYLADALLSGFLSYFSTNLSVTLISRLMLNLHETADARVNNLTLNTWNTETVRLPAVSMTVHEES